MGIVPEDVVCYIVSYHDCYLSLGWLNTWGGHTADERTRWIFTPVPHCLPSSNTYYIRSFNNKYLRREGSGCVSQCNNPYHECEWVVDLLPNGKYTIRLVDYLVCEKNGWIFANRKKAKEWEQWTITSEYNPNKLSGPSGRAHLGFALGGITAGVAAAAGVGVGIVVAAGAGGSGAGTAGAGAIVGAKSVVVGTATATGAGTTAKTTAIGGTAAAAVSKGTAGAGALVVTKSAVVGNGAATTVAVAAAKEIGKMAWKGFETAAGGGGGNIKSVGGYGGSNQTTSRQAAGGGGGNIKSVGGHGGSNQTTSWQALPAPVESFATQVGTVVCLAVLFPFLPKYMSAGFALLFVFSIYRRISK